MKDGLIFLLKVMRKQDSRLFEVLDRLTDEERKAPHPLLPGGSIHAAVAALVSGAVFTQSMLIGMVKSMDYEKLSGKVLHMFEGRDMFPISPFAELEYEQLKEILTAMDEAYITAYEGCDEAELCGDGGLPPYDFASKSQIGSFATRAKILYVLEEMGKDLSVADPTPMI